MSRLQGKVAIITGGNSGIGLATAQRYVEEGAHVFIVGRRQDELDKVVAAIGRNITAVRGDVSEPADLDRLYAQVKSERGGFDILVAAAGIVVPEAMGEISEEGFDRTFDINVRGLLFLVQKGLPLIRDGGSIVLIGSIAAFMGFPNYSTYSASKAAVRSLARTWTVDLKARGIRVNTISPGPIDTPIIDSQGSEEQAAQLRTHFAGLIPLGRMGRADEVANVALFLGSDESSFVAGGDFTVDGGLGAI